MPDETIIEDSTKQTAGGLKPTYSVFLTNKRVIFRFDGIGSSVAQSFFYQEIVDVKPAKRLLINYLGLHTPTRQYFLHTSKPDYWSAKIIEIKNNLPSSAAGADLSAERSAKKKRQELGDMLLTLRTYNLLSADEVEQKKKMLETLQF
jgi:hypothetical protein